MKTLATLLCALALFSCTERGSPQKALLEDFAAYEKHEQEVFNALVFSPVPQKKNKSVVMKFILRDQLGRNWMFKASRAGNSDGIVAMRRFYNLFGLDTPEAHYKTLVVNGQPLEGTVQRFVPNIGGMTDDRYWSLTPAMAEYFARAHLLDWLFANDQIHYENFIVLPGENQQPSGVLRIDNAINWHLMNQDRIDIDYISPWMRVYRKGGYLFFWRPYLQRSFDLPLGELQAWAHFISGMPDEIFRSVLQRGIDNKLEQLANNDSGMNGGQWWHVPEVQPIQVEELLPRILKRRDTLPVDAKRVYEGLAKIRKEALPPPAAGGDQAVYQKLRDRLQRMRASLAADAQAISAQEAPAQAPLEVMVSVAGYDALREMKGIVSVPKEHRERLLKETREKLLALLAASNRPLERQALQNALSNFGKIEAALQNVAPEKKLMVDAMTSALLHDVNRFFEPQWDDLEKFLASRKGK